MWASKAVRRAGMVAGLVWSVLVVTVSPPTASAQQAALELSVERDAQGCVQESSLRARLDRFLRVHGPIDVEVAVHADATPVRFELRHDGVFAAERRFDVLPSGCPARLDALALAIAVAVENAVGPERASVEPAALVEAPAETEEPVASPPAVATEPEPPREAPPAPPAPEPKRPEAELKDEAAPERPSAPLVLTLAPFVGAGMLFEALLKPGFTVHAGAELRLGSLMSASVAALFAPGVDVKLDGVAASSALLGGRALGCVGTEPRGLRLEGCAGAASGAVLASGEGSALEKRSDPTVGWVAAVLRAAASFPAQGRLGARLAVDGHYNLVRPGLRVAGTNPVTRVVDNFGLAASIEVWFALR